MHRRLRILVVVGLVSISPLALAKGKHRSAPTPRAAAPATKLPPPPAPEPAAAPAAAPAPDRENDDDFDDESSYDGASLGLRTGYSLPLGSLAKDPGLGGNTDLSKWLAGAIPLAIDAGYRFSPHFYLGGTFQFAFAPTSSDWCSRAAGGGACTSSANDIKFGANVRYTFIPERKFSPWLGLGWGYEITNMSITVGNQSVDQTVRGFEFAHFQFGGDFHPTRDISIGPWIGLSLAQYSNYSTSGARGSTSGDLQSTSLHEWLTFGVKGQYDL